MSRSLHIKLANIAERLIIEHGREVEILKPTFTGDEWNPQEGEPEITPAWMVFPALDKGDRLYDDKRGQQELFQRETYNSILAGKFVIDTSMSVREKDDPTTIYSVTLAELIKPGQVRMISLVRLNT